MSFWSEQSEVRQYPHAALALSELETAKRGENESRLRLHKVGWSESFGELMLAAEGLSVELALGYTAFDQLCKILGLGSELGFLRGLRAGTLALILQQYTEELSPYEAKLIVHRKVSSLFSGNAHYYVAKRIAAAKSVASTTSNEQWLYCLTLLEQAGWQWSEPCLVQDDLLLAVMFHPKLAFAVKAAEGDFDFLRGLLVLNSEAGVVTSRMLPTVQLFGGPWMVVGDKLTGEALTSDLLDLLEGRVGMFGMTPHLAAASTMNLEPFLTAHAKVTLKETEAYELLVKGGLVRKEAIERVGLLMQQGRRLTGLRCVLDAIEKERSQLNDDPNWCVNHLIKLGLSLW